MNLKADFAGSKIDIVDETAVRNPYFRKELDRTKHLIYG